MMAIVLAATLFVCLSIYLQQISQEGADFL